MEVSEYFSNDLRYDHNIWENELNFYKKELGIFETRLVEMLKRKPSRELLRELEQYQNQFIRQKQVVDNVNHKIHLYDDELKGIPAEIMLTLDSSEISKHRELEGDIKITRKLYFELRDRFSSYLAKFQH